MRNCVLRSAKVRCLEWQSEVGYVYLLEPNRHGILCVVQTVADGAQAAKACPVEAANNFTVTHVYDSNDATSQFRKLGGTRVVVGRLEREITVFLLPVHACKMLSGRH